MAIYLRAFRWAREQWSLEFYIRICLLVDEIVFVTEAGFSRADGGDQVRR